ncbi:hypothetical protein RCL1_006059 [Eukaryota sp. TZLM3-RCL]
MQPPSKIRRVDEHLSSPSTEASNHSSPSDADLIDTPPKTGTSDSSMPSRSSPLGSPVQRPSMSFNQFCETYKPSHPSSQFCNIFEQFHKCYPMFPSFIATYRPNSHTQYWQPPGVAYGGFSDALMAHNGKAIVCLGYEKDHLSHKVPSVFDSVAVICINEEFPYQSSLNRQAFAVRDISTTDERHDLAYELAESLLKDLLDCFCVIPRLMADRVVLIAYVLHCEFRHYQFPAFPYEYGDERLKADVYFMNEFVVFTSSRITQSLIPPSSFDITTGSEILIRAGHKQVIATLGLVVHIGTCSYLVTAAHALPFIELNKSTLVDTYNHDLTVSMASSGSIICSNVSASDILVRLGNVTSNSAGLRTPSVFLDVALIPLDTGISYDPVAIASTDQWDDARSYLVIHRLCRRILNNCNLDPSVATWVKNITPVQFTGTALVPSDLRFNQLLFKVGGVSDVSFAVFQERVNCRVILLDEVELPPNTVHCEAGFDKAVSFRECHSCIVLNPLDVHPTTWGNFGDSGASVYDPKGNIVGTYYALGSFCCYVCPASQYEHVFGASFIP